MEMLEVKDLSVKVEGKLILGGFCVCWEWKIYDPLNVASIFYNRFLL
jgi:hypothetical protein